MVRRVIGLFGCLRGKHERSQPKIERSGDTFTSRCRFCGIRMRRRGKRDWVVDRAQTG